PEAPHDDRERVRLAELRDPLRGGGPARDVDEPDLGVDRLARALDLGQDLDTGVGNGHHGVVRLAPVTAGPRERSEEAGLPAERQADQTDVPHEVSLRSGRRRIRSGRDEGRSLGTALRVRNHAAYALVSQKILATSSIASSSFWPCAGSCAFLARPASLVAFQNSSWSCGYFSTCSGLK